jgi:hypothetical protein
MSVQANLQSNRVYILKSYFDAEIFHWVWLMMARQWIAVGLTSACNCACTLHFRDGVSCLTAPLVR